MKGRALTLSSFLASPSRFKIFAKSCSTGCLDYRQLLCYKHAFLKIRIMNCAPGLFGPRGTCVSPVLAGAHKGGGVSGRAGGEKEALAAVAANRNNSTFRNRRNPMKINHKTFSNRNKNTTSASPHFRPMPTPRNRPSTGTRLEIEAND